MNVVDPAHVERTITNIWSETFGQDNLSSDANFFELGGDSLSAARVLTRVDDELGVQLPIVTQFEAPTIRELAAAVQERIAEPSSTSGRARQTTESGDLHGSTLPATNIQWGLWLMEQLSPAAPLANLSLAWAFPNPVNIDAATAAWRELISRHDALRTVLRPHRTGELCQHVMERVTPSIRQFDMRTAKGEEVAALVSQLQNEPMNLAEAPLARMALVRGTRFGDILLAVFHHVAYDDWSGALIDQEMPALYKAASTGRPYPASQVAATYNDYIRWRDSWQVGRGGEAAKEYWTRTLANTPLSLQLPLQNYSAADGVSPIDAHFDAKAVKLRLSNQLVTALEELARRHQVSTFILMLAAFNVLVHRYTDQDDLVVPTIASGRNRREFDRTVGWFIKALPIRNYLGDNPSFAGVLRRVRDATFSALDHQEFDIGGITGTLLAQQAAQHGVKPSFSAVFQALTTPYNERSTVSLEPQLLHHETTASSTDRRDAMATAQRNASRTELNSAASILIDVIHRGGGMVLIALGVYHEAAVRRLLSGYHTLLKAIISDADRHIGELPVVNDADISVIDGPNPESATLSHPNYPFDVLRHTAEERGNRPAITHSNLEVSWETLGLLITRNHQSQPDREDEALASQHTGPDWPHPRRIRVALDGLLGYRHTTVRDKLHALSNSLLASDPHVRCGLAVPEALPEELWSLDAAALANGIALRIVDSTIWNSGKNLVSFLADQRITALACLPSQFRTLLEDGLLEGLSQKIRSNERLSVILVGAERINESLWHTLRTSDLIHAYVLWGTAELGFAATSVDVETVQHHRPVIGSPLPGVRVEIIDRYGHPVPIGVTGRLRMADRFMATGPHASSHHEKRLARLLDDGNIEVVGGNAETVRFLGYYIEPAKIASSLCIHPDVTDAAVVVIDRNGAPQLVVYVVTGDSSLTLADLRHWITVKLPGYVLPSKAFRVRQIPRRSDGVLFNELHSAEGTSELPPGYCAPQTTMEERICGLIGEITGRNDAVGINENVSIALVDVSNLGRFLLRAQSAGIPLVSSDLTSAGAPLTISSLAETLAKRSNPSRSIVNT